MVSYRIEITPSARQEIRDLPGNMRQRVVRLLEALGEEPRPQSSKEMDTEKLELDLDPGITLHRIRLESWRIVYVIEEKFQYVSVLAIRKRPPYQYDDVRNLVEGLLRIDENDRT